MSLIRVFGLCVRIEAHYLGRDVDRIAWEKGRMMRPGMPAASSATSPVVLSVHRRLASKVPEAMEMARLATTHPEDLILVAGSVFLTGSAP